MKTRRIFSLFLALAMLAGMFTVPVLPAMAATVETVEVSDLGDDWVYMGFASSTSPYDTHTLAGIIAPTSSVTGFNNMAEATSGNGWSDAVPAPIGWSVANQSDSSFTAGTIPAGVDALATTMEEKNTTSIGTGHGTRLWEATMFQKTFNIGGGIDVSNFIAATGTHVVSDGMMIFINGVEVYRFRMDNSQTAENITLGAAINFSGSRAMGGSTARAPAPIDFSITNDTLSAAGAGSATGPHVWSKTALAAALKTGENVITVIQARNQGSYGNSRILYFDFAMDLLFRDKPTQCNNFDDPAGECLHYDCPACTPDTPPEVRLNVDLSAAPYAAMTPMASIPTADTTLGADGVILRTNANAADRLHATTGWYFNGASLGSNADFSLVQTTRPNNPGGAMLAMRGPTNARTVNIDLDAPITKDSGMYGIMFDFSAQGLGSNNVRFGLTDMTSPGGTTALDTDALTTNVLRFMGRSAVMSVQYGNLTGDNNDETVRRSMPNDSNNWYRLYGLLDTDNDTIRWHVAAITEGAEAALPTFTAFAEADDGDLFDTVQSYTWQPSNTINSLAFGGNSSGVQFRLANITVFAHGDADVTCICDAEKETAPVALGLSIDYVAETLSGFVGNARYSFNGGAAVVASGTGVIPINNAWITGGGTVSIVKLGITPTFNSDALVFTIGSRPAAPSAVGVATTEGRFNGQITGLDNTMQWRHGASGDWENVTGTTLGDLKGGIYQVRVAAVAGMSFASLPANVNVAGSACSDCAILWGVPGGPALNGTGTGVSNTGTGTSTSSSNRDKVFIFDIAAAGGDLDEFNYDDGANVVFSFANARGDLRRLFVWTDLDVPTGLTPEATTHLTTISDTGPFPSWMATAVVPAADLTFSIPILSGSLYDEVSDTHATKLYVMAYNNTGTVAAHAANTRFQEDIANAINSLILLPLADPPCPTCGACQVCPPGCDCDPVVFAYPLPLNKTPGQNHSTTRKGWNVESGSGMQLDDPRGGPADHGQMSADGLRYLVVEFKEDPSTVFGIPDYVFGIVFQGNDAGGSRNGINVGSVGYPTLADALADTNGEARTTDTTDWFGGYVESSSVAGAKVSDTLYAFDFGLFRDRSHFQPKFAQYTSGDNRYYMHPGFSRASLYTGFQVLFETNIDRDDGPSFEAFLDNVANAYFVNLHPSGIPEVDELPIDGSNVTVQATPPMVTLDTTDFDNLKLLYTGTLGGGLDAVRMQYRIGDSGDWINIHQDFSIIRASGARIENLPADTHNQAVVQIRWIPHGRWGRDWGSGSYTVSNVRLTTGFQHGELARPLSPVLSIGAIASPPATMVQREETTVAAPAIPLREGGTSNAVLWTSSNATVAKVAGGEIRALSPGTATIRATSALDTSIYTEFTFIVTAGTPNPNLDFKVVSPYDSVDWDTWGQYKTSFHNHTQNSDGAATVAQAVERMYELGYHFAAITDHDRLLPDVTSNTFLNNAAATVGALTQARKDEMAAGTGRAEGPLFFIPGTNEESMRFDAFERNPAGHHYNTFWATESRTGSSDTIGAFIGRLNPDALIRVNHPGRYTGSDWPLQPWSAAKAIADSADTFLPYVGLFSNPAHSQLIGMEIINKFDTESQADRVLWDNILAKTMPNGRNLWGFSDDDAHSNNAIGFSYNLMLMETQSLEGLKESMINGSFLVFSRVDRQYNIYPGQYDDNSGATTAISKWNWDGAGPTAQAALTMPVPVVNSISTDDNKISIDATYEGAAINAGSSTFIDWYADGVMIHKGSTLDLVTRQLNIYSYVRATIVTPTGVIYTQPFQVIACTHTDVNQAAADCVTDKICTDCAMVLEAKLGHLFVNYEDDENATCTEYGSETAACERTGCSVEETVLYAVPPTGHTADDPVTVESDCDRQGTTTIRCEDCDEVLSSATLPLRAHDWGEWVNESTTLIKRECLYADCSADETETVAECTGPGGEHDFSGEPDVTTDPTCADEGGGTVECAHCDETITVTIPVTGVCTFGDWEEDTPADCTTDGLEKRECEDCNAEETRIIEALGHDFVEVSNTQTCTEPGTIIEECACSETRERSVPSLGGHAWGEWVETTPPTATMAGIETRTCSECGATETRPGAPATGTDDDGPIVIGGGGTTTEPEPEPEPETTVEVDLSEEQITEITDTIDEAVADALEEIAELLEAGSEETVTVNVIIDLGVEVDADTTEVIFEVPEAVAEAIVTAIEAIEEAIEDGANVDFSVTLELGVADLTLDLEALIEVFGGDEAPVLTIVIEQQQEENIEELLEDLDDDVAALVEGRKVVSLSITIGGVPVTNFGGGAITVSLPYTLGADEDPDAILVYYLSADGELDVIRGYYNDGFVYFITEHFSMFVVGYNPVTFTDADDIPAWAAGNILFSAARKLFVGSGGNFMPKRELTYAELTAVLSNYSGNSFTVAADGWAAPHIAWGEALGIFGDKTYDYTEAVTRADMAYIIYNFIVKSGVKVSAVDDATAFTDLGGLADEYVKAINFLAGYGIVRGTGATGYDPDTTITREQVASIIANLVRAFSK